MPFASLYGIAALESPRKIEAKSKIVVVDAQFYMGADAMPLLANLRFFNSVNLNFEDASCYSLHATIAKMQPDVPTYSERFHSEDYVIVGDIIRITPLLNMASEEIRTVPWVAACGAITTSTASDMSGSFETDPEQYISAFKGLSKIPSLLPIQGSIDFTSKRYEKNKPALKIGRYIYFTGDLSSVPGSPTQSSNRFAVDVVNHDFLGFAPPAIAPASTPDQRARSSTSSSKKMKHSLGVTYPAKRQKKEDVHSNLAESSSPSS